MSATVKIPTPLRKLTNGETTVDVDGATVSAIVESLESAYPGMRERLIDESGDLRHFVNIYPGERNVDALGGLDAPLESEAVISIVPAVAGGAS